MPKTTKTALYYDDHARLVDEDHKDAKMLAFSPGDIIPDDIDTWHETSLAKKHFVDVPNPHAPKHGDRTMPAEVTDAKNVARRLGVHMRAGKTREEAQRIVSAENESALGSPDTEADDPVASKAADKTLNQPEKAVAKGNPAHTTTDGPRNR
jgi:hypothetical protein